MANFGLPAVFVSFWAEVIKVVLPIELILSVFVADLFAPKVSIWSNLVAVFCGRLPLAMPFLVGRRGVNQEDWILTRFLVYDKVVCEWSNKRYVSPTAVVAIPHSFADM